MEFVPIALACGHIVDGVAHMRIGDGPSRIECPEGCGWQGFVVDPGPRTDDGGDVMDELERAFGPEP